MSPCCGSLFPHKDTHTRQILWCFAIPRPVSSIIAATQRKRHKKTISYLTKPMSTRIFRFQYIRIHRIINKYTWSMGGTRIIHIIHSHERCERTMKTSSWEGRPTSGLAGWQERERRRASDSRIYLVTILTLFSCAYLQRLCVIDNGVCLQMRIFIIQPK